METLIIIMMLLVCFSFVLKQTFHGVVELVVVAAVVLLFTGLMWSVAIEQSRTQITAWIEDSALMLDMAVLMSIDVALTMGFCVMSVDMETSEYVSRRRRVTFLILKYFPGLLIFPVIFSTLVMLIFMLPGVSFQTVAWGLGAALCILLPVLTLAMRWLLPEAPIRLEILFLVNVLLGLMGIIGTVNGGTAVAGISSFDPWALLAVVGVVVAGLVFGLGYYTWRVRRQKRELDMISK